TCVRSRSSFACPCRQRTSARRGATADGRMPPVTTAAATIGPANNRRARQRTVRATSTRHQRRASPPRASPASRSCNARPARPVTSIKLFSAEHGHGNERQRMAKEELIQFEGLVVEILPDARYRVQLDAGHEIVAYTAGKMKKNRIKTLAGDRVTIEMSP